LNESPDKPMLNRPLRGAYPPGSTIKPFLALAALTSGKRTPQQSISDPGFYQLPGSSYRFRDDKPGGHGSVDMYKSIVVSCDTYYYTLAGETDIDDTARFLAQLGFGHETGVDIEGELTERCRRGNGSGRDLPARTIATNIASGIWATRSPPASGRGTTRSRRCNRRRPSRPSPTTASPSCRTW
jgi:penicillin-binding protein 2